ncbi:MAG: hypothetical protein NZ455_09580 [Bacteroidia bacterium]|nr:hypothetical protein [Bacteroidia bacterium]MDW8346929.1 hypothetical protein [Bacteroidia bacterium]
MSEIIEDRKNAFEQEMSILDHAQHLIASNQPISIEEFKKMVESYENLLNDVKLLTSVSDRLQNRLTNANEKLKSLNQQLKQQSEEIQTINEDINKKNTELQKTLDELMDTRNDLTIARIKKRSIQYTVIVSIVLVLISEVIDRFLIPKIFPEAKFFSSKVLILLFIKPIESAIYERLLHRAQSRGELKKGKAALE